MVRTPDQVREVARLRQLSRRERRLVKAVGLAAAMLAVVVAVAVVSAGHSSGGGCVDYSFPYSTGGQEVYRCGAAARAICRDPASAGNRVPATVRTIATACREAGLPVGPAA